MGEEEKVVSGQSQQKLTTHPERDSKEQHSPTYRIVISCGLDKESIKKS